MAGAIRSGPPVGTCRAPKAATSCARSYRSLRHQPWYMGVPAGAWRGGGVGRWRALRRLWLAAARAAIAFAARARACWAMTLCSRCASRACWCAAVCGSQWSIVAFWVQCGAMWCKYGLCGAKRACAMAEPCSHGSFLVRARQNRPAGGRSKACCVF